MFSVGISEFGQSDVGWSSSGGDSIFAAAPAFLRTVGGVIAGRDVDIPAPKNWRGERGAVFTDDVIKLRFAGSFDGPVVLVLGGISANRFVAKESEVETGWWGELACDGGAIDLSKFCVAGVDFFPLEPAEAAELTPADYASVLQYALAKAGVDRLHALVGSSFGGMIGLAFARAYPKALERLAVICAAHRPSPMAQAWRLVQRRTIEFAIDAGRPEEGVALARQLAMTTYRTPEEFNDRFDAHPDSPKSIGGYLKARGLDYAAKTSAARYLTLSAAIDRHDETPEEITTPCLLIGADSDRLVPLADMEETRRRLGGSSQLITIPSEFGHDAFLKETAAIAPHLQNFLLEDLK